MKVAPNLLTVLALGLCTSVFAAHIPRHHESIDSNRLFEILFDINPAWDDTSNNVLSPQGVCWSHYAKEFHRIKYAGGEKLRMCLQLEPLDVARYLYGNDIENLKENFKQTIEDCQKQQTGRHQAKICQIQALFTFANKVRLYSLNPSSSISQCIEHELFKIRAELNFASDKLAMCRAIADAAHPARPPWRPHKPSSRPNWNTTWYPTTPSLNVTAITTNSTPSWNTTWYPTNSTPNWNTTWNPNTPSWNVTAIPTNPTPSWNTTWHPTNSTQNWNTTRHPTNSTPSWNITWNPTTPSWNGTAFPTNSTPLWNTTWFPTNSTQNWNTTWYPTNSTTRRPSPNNTTWTWNTTDTVVNSTTPVWNSMSTASPNWNTTWNEFNSTTIWNTSQVANTTSTWNDTTPVWNLTTTEPTETTTQVNWFKNIWNHIKKLF